MEPLQNRQYYLDPFLSEFDTSIVSASLIEDKYHVVLENTIFYPEGGGQPSDQGYLNDSKILHVYEKDNQIYHVIADKLYESKVKCRLNWDRRFYHMQHHSGQHLMSAVFYHYYNYQTKGFHLGEDYATIDISTPTLSNKIIADAETRINKLIYQDIPIRCYFITKEQIGRINLRKKPTIDQDIRIVEFAGLDAVPCCGTHLKSSGQVGLLKIIKTEKYKSLTRIYFLCGQQAQQDFQFKHNIIVALAHSFSSSEGDVLERVESEIESKRALAQEYKHLQKQAAYYQAKEIVHKAEKDLIIVNLDARKSTDYAILLADEILAIGNYIVIITVNNRLVLAVNRTAAFHCGKSMKKYLSEYDGRGGGNAHLAQAYFPTKEKMKQFIIQLENSIYQNG